MAGNMARKVTRSITINNLPAIRDLDQQTQSSVWGRGVSNAYLFRSAPRAVPGITNLNIGSLEINHYDITNTIDTLIQQTNNQLQLSTIQVEAGAGSAINIAANQGLSGMNSSIV